jgi:hypothetical protein
MDKADLVLAFLGEYVTEAEKHEFLRDHDSRFEGLRTVVKNKSENLRAPLNVISKRLYYVADHSFYCVELFKYKYYLLAKGMLSALETNNPLSLANNCRSLLEQVATLTYCMDAVEEMLDGLKDQGSPEKIDKIISKAELVLQRTYAGKGKTKDSTKDSEAIHVNTAIKALTLKALDASDSYDYLCEFVHPNFGNNYLISAGELGKGKIGSRENSDETIIKIASIAVGLLDFSAKINGTLYPGLTWRAHNHVEICFQKGAKITNVFSSKKPVPEGDGKTKETAFFFKNARTGQESMALSYQYLSECGYDVHPSNRVNGGVGGGHVYDVWSTKDGVIWFKVPFYLGL